MEAKLIKLLYIIAYVAIADFVTIVFICLLISGILWVTGQPIHPAKCESNDLHARFALLLVLFILCTFVYTAVIVN